MTSKEDLCATNKIGPVDSNLASGMWHKFDGSGVTDILTIAAFNF